MKMSRVLAVAILLVGMASNVFAFDITEWKYQAEVTIRDGTTEYGRLILAPDIYNAARRDLRDIRLIGTDGEQVPYVLAKPKDVTERLKYNPKIINRSTNENRAALVTLDFGMRVVKNTVEVVTAGDNFRRAVKIEGSNDNIAFFTLVERAYVFAVPRQKRYSKVDLPANDYRYLRITVEPMATEEKSPVIEEVRAFKIERKFAKREPVVMANIEHREDKKNNLSVYGYDLKYRHLPVSEIELNVVGDSFYRYVTVEGRDTATRKVKVDSEDNRQRFREIEVKWERIMSDTIYRYTTASGQRKEKVVLRTPSDRRIYRYLRVTIKNYDDKPVTVKSASAKMIPHEMVFAADGDSRFTLYVGSKSAVAPQYDLRYRLREPIRIKARVAKPGNITHNPLFGQAEEKQVPWTERHKVLLLMVMGALVLVLGGFILKSFKSIQSEQGQK